MKFVKYVLHLLLIAYLKTVRIMFNSNLKSLLSINLILATFALTSPVSAQNVGIGTATPAEKLHVIGNVRVSTLAGLGNRIVFADPLGTLVAGSGLTSPAWLTTGNTGLIGGNTTTTGTNFLGTTDAQNICFRTNNIERGRFSALGEFFVGAFNTVIAGDLMNAVGNATFPWAINGYVPAGANGGGVYGQVQAGNGTVFASVQGEYGGTNAGGAGVRGLAINPSAIGVQGSEATLLGWAGLFNGDVGAVLPGGFFTVSDKRLKTNITPIEGALDKVNKLKSYSYDANIAGYPKYINSSRRTIGFLAQEVEQILPEAVIEKRIPSLNVGRTDNDQAQESMLVKAVSYDAIIPVLVEAIKEQQLIIDNLNKRINSLEKSSK